MEQSDVFCLDFTEHSALNHVRRLLAEAGCRLRQGSSSRPPPTPPGAVLIHYRHQYYAAQRQWLETHSACPHLWLMRQDDEALPSPQEPPPGELVFIPAGPRELRWRLDRLMRSAAATGEFAEFDQLGLVGDSAAMQTVKQRIRNFAACDAPVLIVGETGTGKELASRALHHLGPRRDGPFVAVNCGGLPDELLINELFGHRKGAFTGATETQAGLVEQADGGTLFLDEVDSLSPTGQRALLRFLQDQSYRPLGGPDTRRSQVRVIAASNADLEAAAARGAFRRDLLFRLDVLRIGMPALRQHAEDIPDIACAILGRLGRNGTPTPATLPPWLQAGLMARDWPGNVRELENHLMRYCLGGEAVVAPPSPEDTRLSQVKARVLASFERHYLQQLMTTTGGNVTRAAEKAGTERRALGKLLKKHGIDRQRFSPDHP